MFRLFTCQIHHINYLFVNFICVGLIWTDMGFEDIYVDNQLKNESSITLRYNLVFV